LILSNFNVAEWCFVNRSDDRQRLLVSDDTELTCNGGIMDVEQKLGLLICMVSIS